MHTVMAIHPCVQLWLSAAVVVVLSVVDRSCGTGCNETLMPDDFTSILVKTYLDTDVEQVCNLYNVIIQYNIDYIIAIAS